MARPIKNNADYFTHDNDMRNDDRVKAVRRKFGLEGYAVYNLMLEYLTNQDYFQVQETELKLELIAGDFDVAPEKLKEMLDYFVLIDLFQRTDEGLLGCFTLNERLIPLLSKRKRDRDDVIADENTQSKVKDSKEKKSKVENPATPAVLPFDSDVFLNAWNEWIQFRIQLRKKIVPSTAKKQLKFLARWPEEIAIKIINQSIEKGWTGLYDPKKDSNNTQKNERPNTNSAAIIPADRGYSSSIG